MIFMAFEKFKGSTVKIILFFACFGVVCYGLYLICDSKIFKPNRNFDSTAKDYRWIEHYKRSEGFDSKFSEISFLIKSSKTWI